MKTLLMTDPSLGLASGYMAKQILAAAAGKAGLTLVENPAEAELVIALGDRMPTDSALNGKAVWQGDAAQALRDPQAFLARAKAEANPWQAPAAEPIAAPVSAAASTGAKRVVAITACPTGVAHTFMAAEAIETEAKKRGWWVKVETRGSVGAGNPITPQEVAEADLVIVATDI